MASKNSLPQRGLAFNQVRCEKHELIVVTQTTTTTGIGKPKIKSISWMQCKHCSYTIPLPEQQLNNP
jgi:hypothetical protein